MPPPVFKALGIDPNASGIKTKDPYAHIQEAVWKYTALELEMIHRKIGACGVMFHSSGLVGVNHRSIPRPSLFDRLRGAELSPREATHSILDNK